MFAIQLIVPCVLSFQNGLTAYDIAESNGHHQVSEELKQHTTQEAKTEITEVNLYAMCLK